MCTETLLPHPCIQFSLIETNLILYCMYTVLKKCSVVIRVSSERNVHRPFYAKTCSARLGLDWTRLGIKGFATFATLSSFFCMFISTRPSIYIQGIFLIKLR